RVARAGEIRSEGAVENEALYGGGEASFAEAAGDEYAAGLAAGEQDDVGGSVAVDIGQRDAVGAFGVLARAQSDVDDGRLAEAAARAAGRDARDGFVESDEVGDEVAVHVGQAGRVAERR